MLYHSVSKHASKALAYTTFVAAWIATEYWYTVGDFSWPWLILGNGFSHDVWAVQWYEYTGVFGGSLWVLLTNLFVFEAWQRRSRRRAVLAFGVWALPVVLSLTLWWGKSYDDEVKVKVSILQPNVDCYSKFDGDTHAQEQNILNLLAKVPSDADFVVLPETAVPQYYWEPHLGSLPFTKERGRVWLTLEDRLKSQCPNALLITGANTLRYYREGAQTQTARKDPYGGWYDHFNTAVGLDSAGCFQLHHKGRLVIGVEKTPMPWLFKKLEFLVIDLGGTLGQIGQGTEGRAFEHRGVRVGASICYEGLYGDFFGDFVRHGADFMTLISNDGWWRDTPGYRHLFTISRLRAIEHRRAIARSANTGRSGFISPRGDVGETLGWDERGIITQRVPLRTEKTFYTRYGDYLGRIAQYILLLCILYYIAYRIKKINYLVD